MCFICIINFVYFKEILNLIFIDIILYPFITLFFGLIDQKKGHCGCFCILNSIIYGMHLDNHLKGIKFK